MRQGRQPGAAIGTGNGLNDGQNESGRRAVGDHRGLDPAGLDGSTRDRFACWIKHQEFGVRQRTEGQLDGLRLASDAGQALAVAIWWPGA